MKAQIDWALLALHVGFWGCWITCAVIFAQYGFNIISLMPITSPAAILFFGCGAVASVTLLIWQFEFHGRFNFFKTREMVLQEVADWLAQREKDLQYVLDHKEFFDQHHPLYMQELRDDIARLKRELEDLNV